MNPPTAPLDVVLEACEIDCQTCQSVAQGLQRLVEAGKIHLSKANVSPVLGLCPIVRAGRYQAVGPTAIKTLLQRLGVIK